MNKIIIKCVKIVALVGIFFLIVSCQKEEDSRNDDLKVYINNELVLHWKKSSNSSVIQRLKDEFDDSIIFTTLVNGATYKNKLFAHVTIEDLFAETPIFLKLDELMVRVVDFDNVESQYNYMSGISNIEYEFEPRENYCIGFIEFQDFEFAGKIDDIRIEFDTEFKVFE